MGQLHGASSKTTLWVLTQGQKVCYSTGGDLSRKRRVKQGERMYDPVTDPGSAGVQNDKARRQVLQASMQVRDVLLPVQHKILLPFRQRAVYKLAVQISNALLEIGLLNGCRGDHTIFDHFCQAVSHKPTCNPAPDRAPCLHLAMDKLTTLHTNIEPAYAFWPASGLHCACVSISTACKNFELQHPGQSQSWNSSCYKKNPCAA